MRVAVVGLGLIGGSVGLAAAARGDEVVAFDPDPDAAEAGLERGAAARVEGTLEAAVADAEIAVVCGPVARLPELVARTLEATGERLRRLRRRLDEGAADGGRGGEPAVRRRPPRVRVGGARRRERPRRPVRRARPGS